MKEPTIRFVKKSDLDALIHLCELHAAFEKAEYNRTNKKNLLSNHLFSAQPSLFCLVVEQSNELVGYTTYMKQFSTWDAALYIYMDCLFLKEASRGYGIGERLIERIKEEARKTKSSHIQWQTPDFNLRAINFYHRIGAKSKRKERFFLDV